MQDPPVKQHIGAVDDHKFKKLKTVRVYSNTSPKS